MRECQRAMSFYQARRCELGLGGRCWCRCGGKLHGAYRFGTNPCRWDFEHLEKSDPHYVKLPRKPKRAPAPRKLSFEYQPELLHAGD